MLIMMIEIEMLMLVVKLATRTTTSLLINKQVLGMNDNYDVNDADKKRR